MSVFNTNTRAQPSVYQSLLTHKARNNYTEMKCVYVSQFKTENRKQLSSFFSFF